MGLFKKNSTYCDICGSETGTPYNKKHKAKDGIVCDVCFAKAGYQRGMVCFADSIEALKNRVYMVDQSEIIAEKYTFDTKVEGLEIDSSAHKWRVKSLKFKPMSFSMEELNQVTTVYDFSDVSYCEYLIDQQTVTSIKNNGVGRAVIGGLMFGGAGAVVGAVTAKDKIKETTVSNRAGIKVTFKDGTNIYIPIFTGNPLSANSSQRSISYGGSSDSVDKMLQEFEKIISYSSPSEPVLKDTPQKDNSVNSGSSSKQLREYKSLLDDGIITQDEFDAKKKQLLNL